MAFLTYKDAGVDIEKADKVLNRIKDKIQATYNPHVLNSIGGFASLTEVPSKFKNPVMVSSTDGVGTKLKIAFQADKHDTVGIDLVAMSVNDILTLGAEPFSFLDYFACGRLEENVYSDVISGICEGCSMAGCALVGGETAEMPNFYKDGEYDLAGFATGYVDREKIISGSNVQNGDIIIALPSSGLHSNGYSMVRKALFEIHNVNIFDFVDTIGCVVYEELLRPTKIYVKPVLKLLEKIPVNGMAHITGGGIPGNIERILPEGLIADISLDADKVPNIFKYLKAMGNIRDEEMYKTFNMGMGFVLVVGQNDANIALDSLRKSGEKAFIAGNVKASDSPEKVHITLSGTISKFFSYTKQL